LKTINNSDLAARNVLLRIQGVQKRSKNVTFDCVLCDFGMARLASSDHYQKTTSDTFPLRWAGKKFYYRLVL
jgi:hypothetical protein